MTRGIVIAAVALVAIAGSPRANAAGDPVLYPDGSHRYASVAMRPPHVNVQVGDTLDIMLEAGESIHQAIISDDKGWSITDGSSGAGGSEAPHVFVKPYYVDRYAVVNITTSRRVYHVRLSSVRGPGEEFIGFYDRPSPRVVARRTSAPRIVAAAPVAQLPPGPPAQWSCSGPVDPRYRWDSASFVSVVSVCNDDAHTYVNLGPLKGPLPSLVVVGEGNQDQLVGNPTFDSDHREFMVDGTPDRLALLRDTPRGQQRVDIWRSSVKPEGSSSATFVERTP